ncbi:MAG: TM2 domain-containing protein [Bacteroidota bacterium]
MKHKPYAILLAVLMGGLGIHRFYVGQKKKGWWYLAFSWTLVPTIISWFDAILFNSMDYAEFNRRYNLGHELSKKFSDDEVLLAASFENEREQKLLQEVEQLATKEKVQEYLENAKQRGDYLPRLVYARANAILQDQPWIMNN